MWSVALVDSLINYSLYSIQNMSEAFLHVSQYFSQYVDGNQEFYKIKQYERHVYFYIQFL